MRQNELNKMGLVKILCDIIISDAHKDIKSEAILVSISMLLGGNSDVQKSFYEYCQNDTQNELINSLKRILEINLQTLRKYMVKKNNMIFQKILQKSEKMENKDTEEEEEVEEEENEFEDIGDHNETLETSVRIYRFSFNYFYYFFNFFELF